MRTPRQFFRDLFRPKAPPADERAEEGFPHVFLTPRALKDILAAQQKRGRQLCVLVTRQKNGDIDSLVTPYGNLVRDGVVRVTCPEVPCYIIREIYEQNPAYLVDHIPLPNDPPGTRTPNVSWTFQLPWPPGAVASDPGHLRISMQQLGQMHPELLNDGAPAEVQQRIGMATYHMLFADANPAMVVAVKPNLVVSAYSGDIDCVVLLKFPSEIGQRLIDQLALKSGKRLISLNSYRDDPDIAPDLKPGPKYRAWTNYNPYIAEFMANDPPRITELHKAMSDWHWRRCSEMTTAAVNGRPLRMRDGRPLFSAKPAAI